MMENASTVAKKGEPAAFLLASVLTCSIVTQRLNAPTLASSKGPVVSVSKKVIPPLSARTSRSPNASTARKKVFYHPLQLSQSLLLTHRLGHPTSECKANRVFDTSHVADMSAEDAWDALQKADEERDLDEIRTVCASKRYFSGRKTDFFAQAFKVYSKAAPDATYEDLELAFRRCGFNTYLIATENELPKTHTHINLQGELDKTYKVGFHLSAKPKRETLRQGWPETPEENIERLKDTGLSMERGIPKCSRCDGEVSYLKAVGIANGS